MAVRVPAPTPPDALAQRFRRFAAEECGASPLYRRLAEGVAADPDLLELAAACPPGQPAPNLLLAAVHYLLLRDPSAPLAAYYATVCGASPAPGDPFPAFRDFCLRHRDAVLALVRSRRVQTNELGRAAVLLPGLGVAAERLGRPFAVMEVGASAGLLLAWERYAYDYGGGLRWGDPSGPVVIRCAAVGDRPPPLPAGDPPVLRRVGIDLQPVDATDPEQVLWLRALVWGDQPERLARLAAALELVRTEPPPVLRGDALVLLPDVLEDVEPGVPACVVHAHTLNQFPPAARDRFHRLLAEASARRPVAVLAMEYPAVYGTAGDGVPWLLWREFHGGRLRAEAVLARYQAHGAWIRWVA